MLQAAPQRRGGLRSALAISGCLLLGLACLAPPAWATSPASAAPAPGAAPAPMGVMARGTAGATDHGTAGAMNHGAMDHGTAGAMNHGAMDHGTAGTMNHGTMDHGAMSAPDADDAPPVDAELLPLEDQPYESIRIEVVGLRWLGPGQQGVIEAHPLIMGLAAMALATVALIFFFLRGVKRPRPEEP